MRNPYLADGFTQAVIDVLPFVAGGLVLAVVLVLLLGVLP